MIDEKKLVADLENHTFKVDIPIEHEKSVLKAVELYYKTLIDCINKQPKIGEWIPCSERLPEEPNLGTDIGVEYVVKEYLVTIADVEESTTLSYLGDGDWYSSESDTYFNVIAWQPLPEPYREDK